MQIFNKALLAFMVFNGLAGCSNKTYPTDEYQAAPVTVDGDLKEWNEPLRFGSNSGQVQYNVTSDNNYVYISLETHDQASALKILRSGVDIYFDPSGGHSKTTCLAFPLPNTSSYSPGKNMNPGGMNSGRNDLRQSLLLQAVDYTASGFKDMENREYDLASESKIKVAVSPESNNGLAYEAAIPLQNIFGDVPGQNYAGRKLSVGIIINAMKAPAQNYRNAGNNGSGRGSGTYGGGRGIGGGGRGGGGNYNRTNTGTNTARSNTGSETADKTALYKKDTNWYEFKLANK